MMVFFLKSENVFEFHNMFVIKELFSKTTITKHFGNTQVFTPSNNRSIKSLKEYPFKIFESAKHSPFITRLLTKAEEALYHN